MDKCHMENLNDAHLPHIDQLSENTSFEIDGNINWLNDIYKCVLNFVLGSS
jgi:hypothetical protein